MESGLGEWYWDDPGHSPAPYRRAPCGNGPDEIANNKVAQQQWATFQASEVAVAAARADADQMRAETNGLRRKCDSLRKDIARFVGVPGELQRLREQQRRAAHELRDSVQCQRQPVLRLHFVRLQRRP